MARLTPIETVEALQTAHERGIITFVDRRHCEVEKGMFLKTDAGFVQITSRQVARCIVQPVRMEGRWSLVNDPCAWTVDSTYPVVYAGVE